MTDQRFPPDDEVVLPALLHYHAEATPDRTYIVFSDQTSWTFADTAEATASTAGALARLGVDAGDTVLSWLPNNPDAIRVWFGANTLGAVFVPLNLAYRGSILEHLINLSGARLLVATADLVGRLAGLNLAHLETVVVLAGSVPASEGLFPLRGLSADVLDGPPQPLHWPKSLRASSLFALIHTSGTTGASKAVRCTYLHHHTYCEGLLPTQGAEDRALISTPMCHVAATTLIYGMLQRGGSIALVDGFHTSTFWDSVRRLGATHTTLVGAMATFLTKAPARADDLDNPLRTAIITPMIPDAAEFTARFGVDLFAGYGSTEATCPLRSDYNPAQPRSCGREWNPAFELRIVDADDREVGTGEVGELILRHDRPWSLNDGYFGRAEDTQRAWRNGWFHTGDALRRDVDGNYFFVDRLKDAVRRRGENISSAEVEAEINRHDGVLEAAVVGVAAEDGDQEVRAFVVAKAASELEPEQLISWLMTRLPHFMVPRYVDMVPVLPRTETQKVMKAALRDAPLSELTWDRESPRTLLRRPPYA